MSSLEPEAVIHPLLHTLKEAESRGATEIIKVFEGSQQIGLVVLHDGRMAWATGTRQRENFSSFLEKIGMITKERQKEIFGKFKTLGGTRELEEMLEETGLISRSTLRDCLKKQIQSALDSLIGTENVIIESMHSEINVNFNLLFHLNEVLPTNGQSAQSVNEEIFEDIDKSVLENEIYKDSLKTVLKNLASLSGYQYSFICNPEAKMLASHKSDSFTGNFEEMMAFSMPYIASTKSFLKESNMGKVEFVLLEHETGSLVAQWHNLNRDFFVAASFDKSGKPGVIRHKISEIIPSILHITVGGH